MGLCVFYLGRELAVWLTVHKVHGFLAFLDNVVAGIAAGLVVLLYERRRQSAADKLRENEEQSFFIKKAVESSGDAIGISDAQGHHFYQNKALSDLFGYATAEELEAAGGGPAVVKDPEVARELFEKIMSGKSWEGELEMVTKSGHVFPAHERADSIKNHDGEVIGLIGIITDITERKVAGERLHDSEEQFRTLAEAIPQLCWMAHGDGHIFWYNQRWYTYTGTTPEQMEGWGWQSVHDPQALPLVLERWKTSIGRGEPFDMVFPIKAANGVFHPFLTRVMPVQDSQGRVVRWFGTNTDITELQDKEEALRESEVRYEQLAEQSRTTHWEVDPQGLFTYVSHASQTSWGYRPDEVVGRMHFYGIHPEEGREEFKAAVFAFAERKQPFRDVVHAVETKDGRIVWGSLNGIPLLNADGTLRGYRGSCTDITERKRAEEALSGMSRKLIEAHEHERTRIGRDLHDDIVQRLALLAIELEGVQEDVPDSATELGRRIGDLRKQTNEITNDVQSLSHELHSSKLGYLGIVGAIKSFCTEFGEHQRLEIDFQSHDLPAALPTDLSLSLFRVLQEALRNATKHSGVKSFEVKLWGSAGEINLTVSDLGVGFDAEAAMKSTGLGLTSMQERLRLAGGELSINSQPKRGTTVHARVPFNVGSDSMRATG